MNKRKNWKLVPVNGRTQKKIKPRTSGEISNIESCNLSVEGKTLCYEHMDL